MKKVGITQRVEYFQSHGEHRDCLDQKWAALFRKLGCLLAPLPNTGLDPQHSSIDCLGLDAIVLSGGNSLSFMDSEASDAAPERDESERRLISEANSRGIPVLGVCRGMQMLNAYYGGSLSRIDGHVATRHELKLVSSYFGYVSNQVNSFHGWGIQPSDLAAPLRGIAFDDSGNVEAFESSERRVLGIMWHPERESPFRKSDLEIIGNFIL